MHAGAQKAVKKQAFCRGAQCMRWTCRTLPSRRGVMRSKSAILYFFSFPPPLLSASALSAFQDALAAAKSGSACTHWCASEPGLHQRCAQWAAAAELLLWALSYRCIWGWK